MENWKTAKELREIAVGKTSESVNKLMDKCMDEMIGYAKKGETHCSIHISSGIANPVRAKIIDNLTELGYTIDTHPTAITIKW